MQGSENEATDLCKMYFKQVAETRGETLTQALSYERYRQLEEHFFCISEMRRWGFDLSGLEDTYDSLFSINVYENDKALLALLKAFPIGNFYAIRNGYLNEESELKNTTDPEQRKKLEDSISAGKWIYTNLRERVGGFRGYNDFFNLKKVVKEFFERHDCTNDEGEKYDIFKKYKVLNMSRAYFNFLISLPDDDNGYIQHVRQTPNPKLLGFFNRSLNVKISAKSREKHTYILAKSGSGKSELMKALIYGDILTRESSIILIDPHGDLADQIAFLKPSIFKNGADDVVYIDPTLKNDLSPSINPFDIPFSNENELARNAQEILNILKVLLKGSDTTAQMSAILEPCISVLLRMKNASFSDLQRFMDDTENADLVTLGKKSPNKQHAKIFNTKFQSKQYETTKNGLYTRMQLLLNDPIFQNLISNKTTLNLNQLIEEKKIIIFRLSLGKGGSRSMEAFGRFIVGMVRIIALQRESTPENQRTHTHLYIDEVQNFITEDLESVLNQLRKYKVFLTSANQLSNQGYSSGLQKALFSSEVLIMGKNEAKTAREVGSQLNIPPQEIQDLSVGNFYLRIGNNEAVKMKVSTQLMKGSYKASKEEIKNLINNSVKKYYKPINQDSSELIQEIKQPQNTAKKQSFSPKFKL